MTRFTVASTRTALFVGIAAVLTTLGCAAGPRPKALNDASAMLTHQDVAELESVAPALVKEAKRYLRQAQEAYDDGDDEQAELNARLAMLRLQTARDQVGTQSARKLAKIMAGHGSGLGDDATRARTRQAELKRFGLLEARISALHDELSRKPEGDSPEVTGAKQALARARRKQAEAIGAGAAGLPEYQQGSSLVSAAIESLEMGIYGESKLSSARALSAFDAAIEKARVPKPDNSQADAAGQQRAEDALADASAAQAMAIAGGAPQDSPALYQRAASLYGAAERRFDRDDYRGTIRLAREAKQAFSSASAPLGAPAKSTATAAGATAPRGSTEALILELRMKRAEMLGAGQNESCSAVFKEFEAVLELAQDRHRVGDAERAREYAIRAEERVKRCNATTLAGKAVGPSEADVAERIAKQRAAEAIRTAQGSLARAQGKLPGDRRLTQPKTLIATAERWFDRGDHAKAERMADQARVALAAILAVPAPTTKAADAATNPARDEAATLIVRAQSMHAELVARLGDDGRLREPERQLREAERWFDRGRYPQAKQTAAKVLAQLTKLGATPAKTGDAKKPLTAEGQRAAEALEAARDAKVRAVVALVSQKDLSKPDRLLELGQKAFDERRYGPARLYAEKARQQYGKLTEAKTGTKKLTPAVASCAEVRDRLDTADRLARRTRGKHLSAAERDLHERGTALATVGRLRLRDQQCGEAATFAEDAVSTLQSLPRAPDAKKKKPTKKRPGKKKPGTDDGVAQAPWRDAYQKVMAALRTRDAARKVVTSTTRRTFDRGLDRLAESRTAYGDKRYRQAGSGASDAQALFESVLAAAGKRPPAGVATARAPEPAAPGSAAATTTPRAPEPAWKAQYRLVYAALTLRDEAAGKAKGDAEKAALERGKGLLARAKKTWKQKSYEAAGELAKLASEQFEAIIGDKLTDPVDPVVAKRKADAALREARVVLQVCERDKCAERDFAELTRAQEMLKSAEESYASQDYLYATELAKKAKDKLSLILTKPRPEAPKTEVDPELERKAKTALAEAEIAQQLCESRDCAKLNLEGWLRAQQSLSAAKSAVADGQLERAARLATQAQEAYGAIQPAPATGPTFTIPAGITAVTRSGAQLFLSPPVDFPSGTAQLKPASRTVLADLAKVITANGEVLQRVQILGFTDSRGNAVINRNISGNRASAVRQALLQAGVPAGLLSSEGRGPDSPIADNATPEGRQANRRVEIHFETK